MKTKNYIVRLISCIMAMLVIGVSQVRADDDVILKKIEKMEARIKELEKRLSVYEGKENRNETNLKKVENKIGEISDSLADTQERAQQGTGILGNWSDKISISGVAEVEGSYESYNFDDTSTDDTQTSDITLSNVELGIDMDISEYVKGNVLLKYEGSGVDVDEGTIILGGTEDMPFSLVAGKFVFPFGMYNSHFVSDPITKSIGETNDNGISLGYANEYFEGKFGVFNGDINESGSDDVLENFAVSAVFTPPLDGLTSQEDAGLSLGLSYINNMVDAGGFESTPVGTAGTMVDYVSGLSGFISLNYLNFTFEAEYVGSLESPDAGELVAGQELKPSAWNFELVYAINDKLGIGGKYEGSNELWNLYPEEQYGPVVSYSLFDNTSLAIEYLHGKFENGDKRDLITSQLAIEF